MAKNPRPDISAWHPRETLDISLHISAGGIWYYRGAQIDKPQIFRGVPMSNRRNERMVKFFASLLRREESGEFFLITPHVKYPVKVDDAPFLAVELRRRGRGREQDLLFRTSVDDVVCAGADHPISAANSGVPEIEIRDGLWAKVSRAVWFELAGLLVEQEEGAGIWGVYSGGQFFDLGQT